MWLEVLLFSVSLIWKSKQCQQKISQCGRKIWWVFWVLFLHWKSVVSRKTQGNSSSWCFTSSVARRAGRNQWLFGKEFAWDMSAVPFTWILISKYSWFFFYIIEVLGAWELFIIKYVKEKWLVMRRLYFISPNKPHLDEICAYAGLYKCPCVIWNVNKTSPTAQTADRRVRAVWEMPKFRAKPEDAATGLLTFCLMISHAACKTGWLEVAFQLRSHPIFTSMYPE